MSWNRGRSRVHAGGWVVGLIWGEMQLPAGRNENTTAAACCSMASVFCLLLSIFVPRPAGMVTPLQESQMHCLAES